MVASFALTESPETLINYYITRWCTDSPRTTGTAIRSGSWR